MSKVKSASTKIPTILIFGLGGYVHGSGTAAALYFAKQGYHVIVTDQKSADLLHQGTIKKLNKYPNVELVLGKHRKTDIRRADLIVRNPGVSDQSPFMQYAHQLKKPITNDVGIFLDELKEQFGPDGVTVVGITGTRGKSTTTALIGHMLQARVGGNIGLSPLTFLNKIKANDVVVLELSSWLLRDLHLPSLSVAVVTNMLRDHMNYYKNMSLYQADKERIFLGQAPYHHAVVNATDSRVRQMAKKTKAQLHWFNKTSIKGVQLLGEHNQFNIGAAWQVGKVFGLTDKQLVAAVKSFKPLANRLEVIRVHNGRTFINDTTATTPDATIAALLSFKKKVILIAGGNSKQLSLTALRKLIPQHVKKLILLPGNANHDFPPGITVSTMAQAVRTAWQLSKPGDIILLSPGVTWLPLMNEFKRGEEFVKEVKKHLPNPPI
ncbi:MAG: UDP-N-acetylmuramoyl-L-alanine--D-glutamate ligase [Patescibacteria group bacterium]|jgi:UDP-N-acetylmuramoylalanine--D-glutamate ligase